MQHRRNEINLAKTEVLHLSRNPDQCVLQVNGATLKQVEKFRYLGVAFTSDGRQDEELVTRIGKASAVTRPLRYSVVMKRESSKKGKALNFQSSFCPLSHLWSRIFGYDRKSAITSALVRNEIFIKNRKSYTV